MRADQDEIPEESQNRRDFAGQESRSPRFERDRDLESTPEPCCGFVPSRCVTARSICFTYIKVSMIHSSPSPHRQPAFSDTFPFFQAVVRLLTTFNIYDARDRQRHKNLGAQCSLATVQPVWSLGSERAWRRHLGVCSRP